MTDESQKTEDAGQQEQLDIPPFLRRADEATDRILEAEAQAAPTFEELESVIKRLVIKRDDIDERIQALKVALHQRIDAL